MTELATEAASNSLEKLTWRTYAVSLLAPLLMTLFFFQGMRAYVVGLYVNVWNLVWIPGSPMLPMLTVLVFGRFFTDHLVWCLPKFIEPIHTCLSLLRQLSRDIREGGDLV